MRTYLIILLVGTTLIALGVILSFPVKDSNPSVDLPKVQTEAPPPTATLEIRVENDDGSWSNWGAPADINIDSDQRIQLRWDSTNAGRCVGTGFSTGGATSGETGPLTLAANTDYSINCY